jgi:hypothetical protein
MERYKEREEERKKENSSHQYGMIIREIPRI